MRFRPNRHNMTSKFSAAKVAEMLPKLRAIKSKNAKRVRELSNIAIVALRELEEIEEAMDEEASREVDYDYVDLEGYKLTYEIAYRLPQAEATAMNVTHCRSVLVDVRAEAARIEMGNDL